VPQVLHALHLRRWTDKESGRRSDLRALKKSAGKARAVIAPSQFIRRKLLELFDIPLDRVVVAPPGTDPLFEKEQESITSKPFFLIVGQMCKGVLLDRVLEGYEQAIKDHPASLVVVGDACDGELADWGPNVVRIESCADPHLAGLYQNCEAFLCLASCDGTGLQVLEAMRAGAPIVAPNIGAIAEYGGDAPAYFNPESTASFLRAVHRILSEDAEERDRRLRQGRQSAREFQWDKSAWKLLNAFKRV
jgi:glycosyltransferase involved in cell wall biosynthesis